MADDPRGAIDDLAAELRRIAAILQLYRDGERSGDAGAPDGRDPATPLVRVAAAFGLSDFERDVLLLCAGMELDAGCAALVAELQAGAPANFALALAALPAAHWSATLPDAPLRRWHLVKLGDGPSLVGAPLRIDERILHHLTGLDPLDATLAAIVEPVRPGGELAPAHLAVADRVAAVLGSPDAGQGDTIVQLAGDDRSAAREIAANAATRLSADLFAVAARDLPDDAEAIDRFARIWGREARLVPRLLMVTGEGDGVEDRVRRLADRIDVPLLLVGLRQPIDAMRAVLRIDIPRLTPSEQLALWRDALGDTAEMSEDALRTLAFQFELDLSAIRGAKLAASSARDDGTPFARRVWAYCRGQARGPIGDTIERIEPRATWDQLVLPDHEMAMLRAIAGQARDRATVYGDWGMAETGARGSGMVSLFAGPSGTGKTLAAEVIANDLSLDLYRIDLSAVVNKYIGETEKNLRRVFDSAEAGGAVLLFDEADALFGKRSEVKDSHDRHANIEVSYLLQRVEAYRGVAILTTNLRDAIDQAFLRRLRFLVQFPFPDAAERAAIWQRMFPAAMPVAALDFARLAQLNVAGGGIRNIALNAAFLAAANRAPLTMSDIRAAAGIEYAKLDRPLTESETRGWL
ncbi:AAA family ATPase [Sphingomonas bacterium]|uniref:ATP-binding protein n=1 Tax=Sphingomonas bacterium TaxID=1895847 RepID=UPI00260FEFC2|nr:AAA family ATPase [Sphingomonas bacterium]MDB5678837.1 ATPase central domain protein [Sphingomonas bacterium]